MTPRVYPSSSTAFIRALNLQPAWTLTVMCVLSMSMMFAISDMSIRRAPSVWLLFLDRGYTETPWDMALATILPSSSLLEGLATTSPFLFSILAVPMRDAMCSISSGVIVFTPLMLFI